MGSFFSCLFLVRSKVKVSHSKLSIQREVSVSPLPQQKKSNKPKLKEEIEGIFQSASSESGEGLSFHAETVT